MHDRATELLTRATDPLRPAGKPLYAGLAACERFDDPLADAWRLADRLREYRKARRVADAGGIVVSDRWPLPQIRLMDEADTSHPFYWSGFAIIGDGARPLITRR